MPETLFKVDKGICAPCALKNKSQSKFKTCYSKESLIKIANILDTRGYFVEADKLTSIIIKVASITNEGGLQDPETPQPTAIIEQINQTDNNLPIYNKVANDLVQFFNSFHEHDEFQNINLNNFKNYRRMPEAELDEQNPQVVKVLQGTNDILDDILIHSLEQEQIISNIAKNNGIDEEIIVDAIYHMIGSHNPLNANQIQAALYEVAEQK